MKKVYSIVVTYNGIKWIDKCLNSLINSTHTTYILVIDNGSSDETVTHIKLNFPQVQVIETGINLGFGQANNAGICEALKNNADYVFLLNQDAWVEPDTLLSLIGVHKNKGNYGIVSPIHLNGDGTAIDAYFLDYLAQSNIKGYLSDCILNDDKLHSVIETSFINAAGWLLSRECICKVGGFDPIFFHYGEDRNYTNRVLHCGFKIAIDVKSRLYHDREDRISKPTPDLKAQLKRDWMDDLNQFCDIRQKNFKLLLFKRLLRYSFLLALNLLKWNGSLSAYYWGMVTNIIGSLSKISRSRISTSCQNPVPYLKNA